MLRNDSTYNLNGWGDHPYAGVLSRGRRFPKIRQCTIEGGGLLKKCYDVGVRAEP